MLFLLIAFLFSLIYLIFSFNELDFFDDSDNYECGSGYPGKSVVSASEFFVSVSGVGFGDFVPIGIKSLGDVVPLVVFIPR